MEENSKPKKNLLQPNLRAHTLSQGCISYYGAFPKQTLRLGGTTGAGLIALPLGYVQNSVREI